MIYDQPSGYPPSPDEFYSPEYRDLCEARSEYVRLQIEQIRAALAGELADRILPQQNFIKLLNLMRARMEWIDAASPSSEEITEEDEATTSALRQLHELLETYHA